MRALAAFAPRSAPPFGGACNHRAAGPSVGLGATRSRSRQGDVFRVEVPGEVGLRRTRMEHMHGEGYYSVNGYNLRDGLRAAIGAEG